jgi:hypothetical protein
MGEGSYYGEAYYGAVNIRRAPLKDMRKGMKRYGNTYGSIYVCLLFGENGCIWKESVRPTEIK